MITRFIETTQAVAGGLNHGKFMVGRFDAEEWQRRCELDHSYDSSYERALISRVGWSPEHLLVWDMQTGEGAIFLPGGSAKADLDKHRVWVCPMFEPFLDWLYQQDLSDLGKLPSLVELPNAPAALYGYRREG